MRDLGTVEDVLRRQKHGGKFHGCQAADDGQFGFNSCQRQSVQHPPGQGDCAMLTTKPENLESFGNCNPVQIEV